MQGRQIIDNIIIVQEVIPSVRTQTSNVGSFVIKVNLEKAYDRINWDFIHDTLEFAGFPLELVCIVMNVICSVKHSVLWDSVLLRSSVLLEDFVRLTLFLPTSSLYVLSVYPIPLKKLFR